MRSPRDVPPLISSRTFLPAKALEMLLRDLEERSSDG